MESLIITKRWFASFTWPESCLISLNHTMWNEKYLNLFFLLLHWNRECFYCWLSLQWYLLAATTYVNCWIMSRLFDCLSCYHWRLWLCLRHMQHPVLHHHCTAPQASQGRGLGCSLGDSPHCFFLACSCLPPELTSLTVTAILAGCLAYNWWLWVGWWECTLYSSVQ